MTVDIISGLHPASGGYEQRKLGTKHAEARDIKATKRENDRGNNACQN
jgi:hypothetical protein